MSESIAAEWKRGDDTRASELIRKKHGLKYKPQCLRAYRIGKAYQGETGQIMEQAYAAVQRRRKKQSK